MQPDFRITKATWQTHAPMLRSVREQVFILEQLVPVELEWDGLDESATHLLAISRDGKAIGCARLIGNGSIGRMAVLKSWRKLGIGKALLVMAIQHYQQQGIQPITLSAQTHAIGFYQQAGFEVCSEPYLDADIMHVDMRL